MSFGSSTPGGSVEGIGGYESNIGSGGEGGFRGLGIGNPGSYGGTNVLTNTGGGRSTSYSQEAMAAALAAADQQAWDNNIERGLSTAGLDWSDQEALNQSTERSMPMYADKTGQAMSAYIAGNPEVADTAAYQARERDWKTLNATERQRAKAAAEQVGMDTSYMGSANKEAFWEKILNSIGSFAGGSAGAAFGLPGSTLGTHLGGKLGTYIANVRDEEEIMRAAGLIGPVTGVKEPVKTSDSLAERIIWPLRKGIRG